MKAQSSSRAPASLSSRGGRPARAGGLAARNVSTPALMVTQGPQAERLLSLDVFRGLTIAAMILVNNPGAHGHVYAPLEHATWNGCTPTDLVFPFFLFIVGVAMTFSLGRRRSRGDVQRKLFSKVVRRTLIIFALGIVLNGFPFFNWSTLRIPGVLQRIAVCYFFAALVMLTMDPRGQAATTVGLLLGYWAMMKLVPIGGHPAGGLGPGRNLAAYIDNALLHGHLLHQRWDPEGILSTAPAIATTLCGVLTGHWLRSSRRPAERVVVLFVAGNVALILGLVMGRWFPINKSLWSSSYVLFTAGAALNVLGMCYWLIDIRGYQRWAIPFIIFGTNALLAYVLSSLTATALMTWMVRMPDGSQEFVRTYIFQRFFLPLASPHAASLLYAVTYTLLWLGIMALLYRQRIFVKI
jgi:predicted acyltransferase